MHLPVLEAQGVVNVPGYRSCRFLLLSRTRRERPGTRDHFQQVSLSYPGHFVEINLLSHLRYIFCVFLLVRVVLGLLPIVCVLPRFAFRGIPEATGSQISVRVSCRYAATIIGSHLQRTEGGLSVQAWLVESHNSHDGLNYLGSDITHWITSVLRRFSSHIGSKIGPQSQAIFANLVRLQ